jgi:hypothetical protein
VGRQAGEEGADTLTMVRVHHEEAERWVLDPDREEASAAALVGVGDSPDMARDGQSPAGYGVADAVADGEEVAEAGNDALDGHREAKVDGVVAVVVEVGADGEGDDDVPVVAGPAAGPAVAAAAVAAVYAL